MKYLYFLNCKKYLLYSVVTLILVIFMQSIAISSEKGEALAEFAGSLKRFNQNFSSKSCLNPQQSPTENTENHICLVDEASGVEKSNEPPPLILLQKGKLPNTSTSTANQDEKEYVTLAVLEKDKKGLYGYELQITEMNDNDAASFFNGKMKGDDFGLTHGFDVLVKKSLAEHPGGDRSLIMQYKTSLYTWDQNYFCKGHGAIAAIKGTPQISEERQILNAQAVPSNTLSTKDGATFTINPDYYIKDSNGYRTASSAEFVKKRNQGFDDIINGKTNCGNCANIQSTWNQLQTAHAELIALYKNLASATETSNQFLKKNALDAKFENLMDAELKNQTGYAEVTLTNTRTGEKSVLPEKDFNDFQQKNGNNFLSGLRLQNGDQLTNAEVNRFCKDQSGRLYISQQTLEKTDMGVFLENAGKPGVVTAIYKVGGGVCIININKALPLLGAADQQKNWHQLIGYYTYENENKNSGTNVCAFLEGELGTKLSFVAHAKCKIKGSLSATVGGRKHFSLLTAVKTGRIAAEFAQLGGFL